MDSDQFLIQIKNDRFSHPLNLCQVSFHRQDLNQEIYSGHVSTVMCHAGNIAWRTGKRLRFDAQKERFDDAQANDYLGREHRRGFELPKIG